ncbi:hypothetical protein VNO78_07464 [Psophocarpus tetragonolobus]|uniref:Uncharacterized protein n=1 Tax=Psophocarpus tetragonolobus TaxID=3891 RepID=A0AAN9SW98_PSOTE
MYPIDDDEDRSLDLLVRFVQNVLKVSNKSQESSLIPSPFPHLHLICSGIFCQWDPGAGIPVDFDGISSGFFPPLILL